MFWLSIATLIKLKLLQKLTLLKGENSSLQDEMLQLNNTYLLHAYIILSQNIFKRVLFIKFWTRLKAFTAELLSKFNKET